MKFVKILEFAFYLLFLVTPLLFNFSSKFPSSEVFELNKMLFVYALTVIIVFAWVARMVLERRIIYQKTPFQYPLLFYLLAQALATLFSLDRHVSIFGYYSRFHGGLLSTLSYTLLYFAFVSNFPPEKLKRLFLTIMTSASLVAIYGILEKFGIDKNKWVQDVQSRVFSTFGQPNWLAAYLAILLPISIYQVFTKFSLGKINVMGIIQKSILRLRSGQEVKSQNYHEKLKNTLLVTCYLSLVAIFYTCLLFTKSRSGFLGFWVANILFWLLIYIYKRNLIKNLLPVFILLNSSFLILNFFIKTPFSQYNKLATVEIFDSSPAVAEIPPVGDTVINVGITDSSRIRKIVWKGAVSIIKNYPLFGTGPETFAFAYYKFRPAEHNLTSEWDFLYNRAHNEFLNIAATSGLFGLVTYLWLILVVFRALIKYLQESQKPDDVFLISALISAYLSILTTNFFGFSVVLIALFFFLLPGMAHLLSLSHTQTRLPQAVIQKSVNHKASLVSPSSGKTWEIIYIVPLGLITFGLLFFILKWWYTDTFYARAINLTRQGYLTDANNSISAAVKSLPSEPLYQNERAEIANLLLSQSLDEQNTTSAAIYSEEAITASNQALKISPQNVKFWKTRTRIFFALSRVDPEFNKPARDAILVAQELAPTDPNISYNVGVIYSRLGEKDKAIKALNQTIELKPDYRDAYIALSIIYNENKDNVKAREVLELILKRINPDDPEIKTRLSELGS